MVARWVGRLGRVVVCGLVVWGASAAVASGAEGEEARADSSALEAAARVHGVREELAARDLWPGFDARTIPLALFDGETTWLFGHPSPSDGFEVVEGTGSRARWRGRHPAVTANSFAEIDGVVVATLMPSLLALGPEAAAATAIHESFHVFQRREHEGWMANEMDAFAASDEGFEGLSLRRRESRALVLALGAEEDGARACWMRSALALRAERFAGLPPELVTYERKLELFEGLAQYVEFRAAGRAHRSLDGVFAPEALRWRVYWSGHAWARLLDRVGTPWRSQLQEGSELSLDELLARAVAEGAGQDEACVLSEDEVAAIDRRAAADIAALRARRQAAVEELREAPGWRIRIESPAAPLWPQGFDPLNLDRAGGGKLVHTRFLKLGNDAGTVEVLGHHALTEPYGNHPLYQGIRSVTIVGLPDRPAVERSGEDVRLEVGEIQVALRGATVSWSDRELLLRLAPADAEPEDQKL